MILPSDYVDVINFLHVVIALCSFCGYLTFTPVFLNCLTYLPCLTLSYIVFYLKIHIEN